MNLYKKSPNQTRDLGEKIPITTVNCDVPGFSIFNCLKRDNCSKIPLIVIISGVEDTKPI